MIKKQVDLCRGDHQFRRVAYVWETINRIFKVCARCGTDVWEVYQPEREKEISLAFDPYQRSGEGGFKDTTEVLLLLVLLVLFLPTLMAWQAALAKWFAFSGG